MHKILKYQEFKPIAGVVCVHLMVDGKVYLCDGTFYFDEKISLGFS